jgi:hypothetical protein
MNRGRVALALLSGLLAVTAVWMTVVAWAVFGIHRSMEPTERVGPLDGWGVITFGAVAAGSLIWLTVRLLRSARHSVEPPG